MSSNTAGVSPTPGGVGLWVKVIVSVALVIAGYAYIWSLVHSGSGQEATAGVKPQAVVSTGKAGPAPVQIPVGPTSASGSQSEASDIVSFGPGALTQNRAAAMPLATAVVVEPKPGAGVALPETGEAAAAEVPERASDAETGEETVVVAKSETVEETTAAPEAVAPESAPAAPAADLPEATPAAASETGVPTLAETQPAAAVGSDEAGGASGPDAGTATLSPAAPEPMAVPAAADPSPEAAPAVAEPITGGSDTDEAAAVEPAAEADSPAVASPTAMDSEPSDPGGGAAADEGFRSYSYRPRVPELMREYQRLRAEARAERARGRPGYGPPGYGYPGPYSGVGGGGARGYGPGYYGYPYGPQPSVPPSELPARAPQ